MKKIIIIFINLLLLIPSLSFSESESKIIDTYFSDDNCVEVGINYYKCNNEGISFYGKFIDGIIFCYSRPW